MQKEERLMVSNHNMRGNSRKNVINLANVLASTKIRSMLPIGDGKIPFEKARWPMNR